MSSRTTITSSTLLLKTPTVRTTSQKSSLSMDLGEFWGLPCALCTVQWSVHGTAPALEAEQYCQNCQKYFHHHHHIIVRMILIAVATRCHLHCNNLDYSIQARGAHMGPEHASREKKLSMVIFFIFVQKNVSTIRFQEIKIRPWKGFEKMRFLCFYIIGV